MEASEFSGDAGGDCAIAADVGGGSGRKGYDGTEDGRSGVGVANRIAASGQEGITCKGGGHPLKAWAVFSPSQASCDNNKLAIFSAPDFQGGCMLLG